MFRLIDITIDIIFFSINWKNYFDRSILVISMTVLLISAMGIILGVKKISYLLEIYILGNFWIHVLVMGIVRKIWVN